MNNLSVLTKKECTQMTRELKIIWLPLVFIFLGIIQPVVSYYMPFLLKAFAGNEGITIDPNMAAQKGEEILASTLGSQFDQLGIMIIIVSLMGAVQSEKANGMLAFILTRPIKVIEYLGAKIISNFLFVATSVIVGYTVSGLYVNVLFTDVQFANMLTALFLYLIWVLFIVSFITMVSTILNSQGIIALTSIVFLLGCRIIAGFHPIIDSVNPATVSKHAMEYLVIGTVDSRIVGSVFITLLLTIMMISISNIWISKKKFHVD
ncbi:ABC transporter permease [Gracilibacillus saliphilus]|uniref:ABC transporter permease n=1 Tax=Gracilibacillus saliphilus TaxID=543890 RepID=UPI0013D8C63C|nr:ABC transporter permease subunit [Gracilibacillus saliphilus]